MTIKKAKLNCCAVCSSQNNLHPKYDVNNKLYFLCNGCCFIDTAVLKELSKLGNRRR